MTEAGKVMTNKAKDIRAYCEAIQDCRDCPFYMEGNATRALAVGCGLNFPSRWILGEGDEA